MHLFFPVQKGWGGIRSAAGYPFPKSVAYPIGLEMIVLFMKTETKIIFKMKNEAEVRLFLYVMDRNADKLFISSSVDCSFAHSVAKV